VFFFLIFYLFAAGVYETNDGLIDKTSRDSDENGEIEEMEENILPIQSQNPRK